MTLTSLLALATLLISAPLNWFVVWKSWQVYRASRNPVALAAVVAFMAVAIIVTVFGLIFVSNDLAEPLLSGDETRLITRSVLFGIGSIPAAWWLWIYR